MPASEIFKNFKDKASEAFEAAREKAGPALESAKGKVAEVREKAGPALESAKEMATDAVGTAKDKASGAVGTLKDRAAEVFDHADSPSEDEGPGGGDGVEDVSEPTAQEVGDAHLTFGEAPLGGEAEPGAPAGIERPVADVSAANPPEGWEDKPPADQV